jgi:diphosphomevalonate decarboxylase
VAGTNIALVKYWGKRDPVLNLPATGSLSLTLKELGTRTTVIFGDAPADRVTLNGAAPGPQATGRITKFLDLVRERAGISAPATVISENTVPTASGLASSASGFAALALAASRAAGLALSPTELSALARRGSGSAARSIFGGFVEMAKGDRPDGTDAVAAPLAGGGVGVGVGGGGASGGARANDDPWAVRLVIAVTAAGEKPLGSTAAMERTARTSPFYAAWVAGAEADLAAAREAIAARDLPALGAVAERSALRMHATALAADPGIVYWNGATLAVVHAVHALRAAGVSAYFTIDAGPHVKVLCGAPDAPRVETALQSVSGVLRTIIASPGPGVEAVE